MLDRPASARSWWPIPALAVAAIVVALVSRHLLFPAYSWNRDETVYLWQVAGLRAGQFTSTTAGFPQFFHPWLAGVRGHSFFSQYTLGWPLVLLGAQLAFGSPDAALALGSALTVVGTYVVAREILQDSRVAGIAAIVMLTSPILIIQSGIYLGYLFTLGLGLLFTAAVVSGVRTGKHGRLVGAGLLVGWIFMTRPFDAVLWAGAVVGVVAWSKRREPRAIGKALVAIGLGFLPLLVAALLYNRHVTGSFTQFPITAADPLDTFGFGQRRIMPTFHAADYTVFQAVRSTAKQALYLPIFLTGSYVVGALALVRLWRTRREDSSRVLLAIGLAFPVGYFFFWGMFVSSPTMPLSGPIYFIPLYAVLAIAGSAAMVDLWGARRKVAVWVLVAIVVITVPVGLNRIDVNRRISESQLPWKRSSAAVPPKSLVFVWQSGDYLMFLNPYSVNTPAIDGPVLYSADLGAANLDLIAAYPHRTPYLQQTSIAPKGEVPTDHPQTPTIELHPIRVVRGRAIRLRTTIRTRPGLSLYAKDATGRLIEPVRHGRRSVELRLQTGSSSAPGVLGVGESGTGTITFGLGKGTTAAAAAGDPVFREAVGYRVADGRISILTPIDRFRIRVDPDRRRWEGVPSGVASPVSLATIPVPLRK